MDANLAAISCSVIGVLPIQGVHDLIPMRSGSFPAGYMYSFLFEEVILRFKDYYWLSFASGVFDVNRPL